MVDGVVWVHVVVGSNPILATSSFTSLKIRPSDGRGMDKGELILKGFVSRSTGFPIRFDS